MTVFLSSVQLAESVQIIIGCCLRRTMQCNNVMLVMINHPTLFHSIAGCAIAMSFKVIITPDSTTHNSNCSFTNCRAN